MKTGFLIVGQDGKVEFTTCLITAEQTAISSYALVVEIPIVSARRAVVGGFDYDPFRDVEIINFDDLIERLGPMEWESSKENKDNASND